MTRLKVAAHSSSVLISHVKQILAMAACGGNISRATIQRVTLRVEASDLLEGKETKVWTNSGSSCDIDAGDEVTIYLPDQPRNKRPKARKKRSIPRAQNQGYSKVFAHRQRKHALTSEVTSMLTTSSTATWGTAWFWRRALPCNGL